jgi:hypothetical protein
MKLLNPDIWIGVVFISAAVILIQLVLEAAHLNPELNLLFRPIVFAVGSSLSARSIGREPIRTGILVALIATLFQKTLLTLYHILLLSGSLLGIWFLTIPLSLLVNGFYGFLGGCWAYYQLTSRKA